MGWFKKIANYFVENFKEEINKSKTDRQEKNEPVDETTENVSTVDSLLIDIKKHKNNYIKLHFDYLQIIDLFYKKRKDDEASMNECIKYCIKDIELYPSFRLAYDEAEKNGLIKRINEYKKQGFGIEMYGDLENRLKNFKPLILRIPAFKQLAIIYEQQKKYDEAIKVCNKALEYGLSDGTKDGFEARINRLKNKVEKVL